MKKFFFGFSTCFIMIVLSVLVYVGHLLYEARSGLYISPGHPEFSAPEKSKIVGSLIKLGDLSNLINLEKYSALFLGSAGAIETNPIEANYHFNKAILLSKSYGEKKSNFDPYLEMQFTYASYLMDHGEVILAKQVAAEALAFASAKALQGNWVGNLERLNQKL